MNYWKRNRQMMDALGIVDIRWTGNRRTEAMWCVKLADGEDLTIFTPRLGTERTVIRVTAEKLAAMGRMVGYPVEAKS